MPEEKDCEDLLDQANNNSLTISFGAHISPLFSTEQVECMRNGDFPGGFHATTQGPVLLINYEYMSDPAPSDDGGGTYPDYANARNVLDHLTGAVTPRMPPGEPWPKSCTDLFAKWITQGCKP